jgi:hypothetical protein
VPTILTLSIRTAKSVLSRYRHSILAVVVILASAGIIWLPFYLFRTSVEIVAYSLALALPITYLGFYITIELERGTKTATTDPGKLEAEYKVLNQSVGRRENSLLIAGSIFVTASLVLLGQSTTVDKGSELAQLSVFTSWAVYSTWLFLFQLTAQRGMTLTYQRLRELEGSLGIEAHLYLNKKRDPARRWVWLMLLNGLIVSGTLILGFDTLYLRISLTLQIIGITCFSWWNSKRSLA